MDILKSIQKKELGALNELRRICEKHNIQYFLAQGTLIGAVRERGFIPWDDDIDIIIYCTELEKLIKIFRRESDSTYMITNYKIEKHFPLSWTKIRIANTRSCPVRYKDIPINWGICIDLFPIFPLSGSSLLRRFETALFKLARKTLMAEMTQYEDNRNLLELLMEKIPISVRHLFMDAGIWILTRHRNDSEYVFITCKGGHVMKRSLIFGGEQKLMFEGSLYPVPADCDGYLTALYGDYMTPPPKDEQKGHDMLMGEIEWQV